MPDVTAALPMLNPVGKSVLLKYVGSVVQRIGDTKDIAAIVISKPGLCSLASTACKFCFVQSHWGWCIKQAMQQGSMKIY
jgi:hypothetical protein